MERLITPGALTTATRYLAFEREKHMHFGYHSRYDFLCGGHAWSHLLQGAGPSQRKRLLVACTVNWPPPSEHAGIGSGINGSSDPDSDSDDAGFDDAISRIIPDLTGYISPGRNRRIRPGPGASPFIPDDRLPSLSRLMKDGVGDNVLQEPMHQDVAKPAFSPYAKVGDAQARAGVGNRRGWCHR